MNEIIKNSYLLAKDQYHEFGIETDNIIEKLSNILISIHCWQGDDVRGFENINTFTSHGGIEATGNYPGRARTIDELRMDLLKAISLIPGKHRINLHASYGDFREEKKDRNEYSIEFFQSWIDWAKTNDLKIDFNSTLFSHPNADSGFTLSHKSKKIRDFWIEHVIRCREIGEEIGKQLNDTCIHNIWIPDGSKDIPVDRITHRNLLKQSLDEIFSHKFNSNFLKDSLEGKLFGIGSESFVVGSHDFYLSYAIKNGIMFTLDTGHYHPTESVGEKISAIIPFVKGLLLHISRGVRWDSDHVAILNDDLIHLAEEIVRSGETDKIHLALDFFDASINRIGAWVIGGRSTQKSLLYALLQPLDMLKEYEEKGKYFQRLALLEELKTLPFGAVWDYFCLKNNVPIGIEWIKEIEKYENSVLIKRIS